MGESGRTAETSRTVELGNKGEIMPTANINGFVMYYETKGDGFPLVHVHGGFGGLGTGLFETEVPAWRDSFAQHFQVITYDRRAAGRSSYPEDGYTMQNFAKDLRELLRYLGHSCAHVWGTSAGGHIALAFGLEYPDAAASLVIADSAPWLSLDPVLKDRLRKRIQILDEQGPSAAYEARAVEGTVGLNIYVGGPAETGPGSVTEEERRSLEDMLQQARAQLRAIPREERITKYAGELRNYSAYVDWDATPRLHELKPPTLVIYGTEDRIFPAEGSRTMVQLIPNVKHKAFEGAGHGVTIAYPEAIDVILSFLLRHTPGQA